MLKQTMIDLAGAGLVLMTPVVIMLVAELF